MSKLTATEKLSNWYARDLINNNSNNLYQYSVLRANRADCCKLQVL